MEDSCAAAKLGINGGGHMPKKPDLAFCNSTGFYSKSSLSGL